jgi:putative ABC transport system substrate-binding protein
MRRRHFITVLGGAAAWPLAARAQQPQRVYRIGFITFHSAEIAQANLKSLRDNLRKFGLIEMQNLHIESWYAAGREDRLSAMAEELVRRNLDLVVTHAALPVRAIQRAGGKMPVVFVAEPDPVGAGVVASLARPGGNVTGLSDLHSDLVSKRLQLLKEAVTSVSRVAILWDARVPSLRMQWKDLEAAAPNIDIKLLSLETAGADLMHAFGTIQSQRPDALMVFGTPSLAIRREEIFQFTDTKRLPAIYTHAAWVQAGGLMSYGSSHLSLYGRAAYYVHRIIEGIKPADIPVEQPTKFELVINLKTAKTIKLEIPPLLLARADEVIE